MGTPDGGLDGSFIKLLSQAWFHLRLSVNAPLRCPTWDAIILTATSPAQANLYQRQLESAKAHGRIAQHTVILAVPDPDGKRIGSGGATLGAIQGLQHLLQASPQLSDKWNQFVSKQEVIPTAPTGSNALSGLAVLLIHAGGDSKRVPWANPMGKPFIPLPLLAGEDPDGAIPTLFDHILAISVPAAARFRGQGGMLILTGDVLPCFDSGALEVPADAACVVTVPATPDVAARHGVIISSSGLVDGSPLGGAAGPLGGNPVIPLVDNLVQKPSLAELVESNALVSSGAALLDTGIFAVSGSAWRSLIDLALAQPDPVLELLHLGEEMSLYEELAGAWVPKRHSWLSQRPLGPQLIAALGGQRLHHHLASELVFLHFGTSGEILDHMTADYGGHLARRHLSAEAASTACCVAPSAVLVASEVLAGGSVGEGSLVCDTVIGPGVRIGSRCVVVGIDTAGYAEKVPEGIPSLWKSLESAVPDHHCLWTVPFRGGGQVAVCCGVDDNPKTKLVDGGTFCGRPWGNWCAEHGLSFADIWPERTTLAPRNLWQAQIFPCLPAGEGLPIAMWLMGVGCSGPNTEMLAASWRGMARFSLSQIHSFIDFEALDKATSSQRSRLIFRFASQSVRGGSISRNLYSLTHQLQRGSPEEAHALRSLAASMCPPAGCDKELSSASALQSSPSSADGVLPAEGVRAGSTGPGNCASPHPVSEASNDLMANGQPSGLGRVGVPASRMFQAAADLYLAIGDASSAKAAEGKAFAAVVQETAVALGLHRELSAAGQGLADAPAWPKVGTVARVELPVRVDIAGGWSDTPPWSLERVGRVLNFAVNLDGKAPVGAEVTVVRTQGIVLSDDGGNTEVIHDPGSLESRLVAQDSFALVKAALLVTRFAGEACLQGASFASTSEESSRRQDSEVVSLSAQARGQAMKAPSQTAALVDGRPKEGFLLEQATPESHLDGAGVVDGPEQVPGATARGVDVAAGGEKGERGAKVPSPHPWGLVVRTWANVPRGSGLGTSSILAAALVKALLIIARHPGAQVADAEVSDLVLLAEQRMGAGGGWQDQVGGLFPGVKYTTSLPCRPLRLVVEPIPLLPDLLGELQARLVLVFTGQVRLARNVLEKVVRRYLQRDARMIGTVNRLILQADRSRHALAMGDLMTLGRLMNFTWQLHQELDPYCSNPQVDELFLSIRHLSCGQKLVGAGGGGFAVVLGKSRQAADEIRRILGAIGDPVKVYAWSLSQG